MINKYLLYIIIVLTTLQSVDAVADAVKYHQPSSEFSEKDYFANKMLAIQNIDHHTSDSSQPSSNTDHCCACHGVTTMLPMANIIPFGAIVNGEEISSCRENYLSLLITPDLRPPIV